MVSWSTRNLLIATILLAALFGGVTGLGTSYFAHPAPAPQTRDVYLFAQDLSFSAPSNLSSDYVYSSNLIVFNKGDTVNIHFYNPTDQHHSFTIRAPYANDVVGAAESSTLQSENTTIT